MNKGDRYERTYELRAAAGEDVHGEANFVSRFSPGSVLDAGCGTGRVGRELHRRGVDVVGVDLDAEMLETARARCPSVEWIEGDISVINLGRTFDVVLMAGNVINFVTPERRQAGIGESRPARAAGRSSDQRTLDPAGRLPAGTFCRIGPRRQAWSWSSAGRPGIGIRSRRAPSTR